MLDMRVPARAVVRPVSQTAHCLSALGLAALMAAAAASGAQAQTLPGPGEGGPGNVAISPPSDKLFVSSGGVDLRTQQMAYEQIDLTTGAADSRIALKRSSLLGVPGHLSPFGNFSHNFDIVISETRVNIEKGDYQHGAGSDFRMVVRGGGVGDTFESPLNNSSGFQHKSSGPLASLTVSGDRTSAASVYTYVTPDGTILVFRPIGGGDCAQTIRCASVEQVTYPDGTRLDFVYEVGTSSGNRARLLRVTSNRGFALLFNYGQPGIWNAATKACLLNLAVTEIPGDGLCPSGHRQTRTYAYGALAGEPALLSVTASDGAIEQFSYAPGTNPQTTAMSFFKPGSSVPWLVNEIMATHNLEGARKDVVLSQTFADGRQIGYAYFDPSAVTSNVITELTGGEYTDQLGTVKAEFGFPLYPPALLPPSDTYPTLQGQRWQVTSGPVTITDQLGRATHYDYCDPYIKAQLAAEEHRCVVGELISWTDPDGITTFLSRDARRNIVQARQVAKAGTGLADLVVDTTYACNSPKTCIKPATITDARRNMRSFTYSSDHGGVLTETSPAVNGVQAVKRYAYAQHYAWLKGPGGYVQAASPIWLPTEERTCRTSATVGNGCAAGAADEVVVSYEYEAGNASTPSNLLLKGKVVSADGGVQRSCYGYDNEGNRIWETRPRAALTVCS